MDTQAPIASAVLALACVVLHMTQREVPKASQPPPLRRMDSDSLSFSGMAVAQRKWWVWFTATLHHGGRSHVVNNVAMLLVLAPPIEARVGPLWLTLLFFGTGAAGWAATYLYTRVMYAEMWSIGAAQYLSMRGASPATYALAVLAIMLLPVGGAGAGGGSCDADRPGTAVGTAFGIPQWLWTASIVVLPFFCAEKYRVDLFSRAKPRPAATPAPDLAAAPASNATSESGGTGAGLRRRTGDSTGAAAAGSTTRRQAKSEEGLSVAAKWALLVALHLAVWAAFALGAFVTGREPAAFMDAGVFAVVYFGKVFLLKVYRRVWHPTTANTTDDAAHLGGAIAGVVAGLVWQAASSGFPGVAACATWPRLAYVGGSVVYLAAALALRKG